MKQTIKRVIISGAVAALLVAPAAFAHDGEDHSVSSGGTSGSGSSSNDGTARIASKEPTQERVDHFKQQLNAQLEQMKKERQAAVEDKKAEVKQKLDDAKKRICENHRTQINKIMTGMNDRRQHAFDRITQVSEAVQTYVTSKDLTVTNYEDLLATIVATKAAASATMSTQQSVPQLDCGGDHPRSDITDFKDKRSDSIDAMKAYRDAVKALVKAVKEAAVATTEPEGEKS